MAEKISGEDLKSRKDEFVIIDVRESDELESGKIRTYVMLKEERE